MRYYVAIKSEASNLEGTVLMTLPDEVAHLFTNVLHASDPDEVWKHALIYLLAMSRVWLPLFDRPKREQVYEVAEV